MDYEKEYKKLKAGISKAYLYAQTDSTKAVLENILPELAESEDERIRMALIKLMTVAGESYVMSATGFKKERLLAYLEKQKYDRMQPIYDNQESFESALDKAWKSYNDSGARTVDGCEDNYTECAYAKGFREGYLFGLEKQKNLDKMIVVSPEVWDNAISDAYENGKKDEEKQKEQKPIEIDKEINRWMGCEAFPEGTNITTLPQAMEIVERTAKHFFELGEKTVPSPGGYWKGFNAGVRECQAKSRDAKGAMKEQEPELYYDKELDNAAREFYLSGGAVSPIDSTGLVPIVRMAEFGATWMKERMEKEQKPVEKQDYSGLNDLERVIHRGFLAAGVENVPVTIIKETAQECLTNIKPAWSEEDEEHLKSIISTIKMCMRDCENANAVLGYYDSDISWLKSLSPSWKPSEEQMNALYNVINPCDHVDKKALESLYKQLEKLI